MSAAEHACAPPRGRGRGLRADRWRGGRAVATGTLVYTLGGGWSPIDGFHFAVAALTTSSIADPELVLEDPWLKVFTGFYVLLGIGTLVESPGRLGISFIEVRRQDAEAEAAKAAADSD